MNAHQITPHTKTHTAEAVGVDYSLLQLATIHDNRATITKQILIVRGTYGTHLP